MFRKWAGISALAATLEQRVWTDTGDPLYPNMYIFLVGPAGVGKTRAIHAAADHVREIEDVHFSPTAMTRASLTDSLASAKCSFTETWQTDSMYTYNSMYCCLDEFSVLMSKPEPEVMAFLTTFYDVRWFKEAKRIFKHDPIEIDRPQLNLLAGTTPSVLLQVMPDIAWEQGLCSRSVFVYAEDRVLVDIFAPKAKGLSDDLVHDLQIIRNHVGQFDCATEYSEAIENWRRSGEFKGPKHPRYEHYNTRRTAHLIKLSMIASLDVADDLTLKKGDFNKAMGWLLEAEANMHLIFEAGSISVDSRAMDEVYHYVSQFGEAGAPQHMIVNMIRKRITYGGQTMNILEVMEQSGMIKAIAQDRFGLKTYRALPR